MDDWKSIWNSAGSFSHTPWTLCKFWTQCSFHHLRMFNFLSLHSLTKLAENYKKVNFKKKTLWLCCHCSHEKLHARHTVHNLAKTPMKSLFYAFSISQDIFVFVSFENTYTLMAEWIIGSMYWEFNTIFSSWNFSLSKNLYGFLISLLRCESQKVMNYRTWSIRLCPSVFFF